MQKFEDERAERLSALWLSQRETATLEQKNRVGLAYISKALNLGEAIARRFASGEWDAYHQVGMLQGGAWSYKADLESFWRQMKELFPGVYSDEDIRFLVEEGEVSGVWHFIWQLQPALASQMWHGAFSEILDKLHVNAHAYK